MSKEHEPVSLDALRSACIDYVVSQREQIDPLGSGFLDTQTPGGLEISIYPGAMRISGTFETPFGAEELEVEYSYMDPNSPQVRRNKWDSNNSYRAYTFKKVEHSKVATELMGLLDIEIAQVNS